MTPETFLRDAIDPACDALSGILCRDMGGDAARSLVLAICLQESALQYRRQVGEGGKILASLARSFAQFERGGGVKGVMTHPATRDALAEVCRRLVIPFEAAAIHEAMAWNDLLAASMARLLLYSDPAPIPPVGEVEARWEMYERNWRPGKPRPDHWPEAHGRALQAVRDLRARPADFLEPRYEPADAPVSETPTAEADMTKDDVAAIVAAALAERERRMAEVVAAGPVIAEPAPAPKGSMVVTPSETVVAPSSNPLKPDIKSAAFWVAVLFTVLPSILDLVTSAAANNPALANMPWMGGLIYGASQLRKIAGLIQLPAVRAPEPR